MAIKTKKVGARRARKARKGRRAARPRMDEGETTSTASPYRDLQREYTTALWL